MANCPSSFVIKNNARKASAAFLSRCGQALGKAAQSVSAHAGAAAGVEAILSPTGVQTLLNSIRKAETKLRAFLAENGNLRLPLRQLPEETVDPKATQHKKEKAADSEHTIVPIAIGDDGSIKETVATRAHDLQVSPGSHVMVNSAKGKKRKFVITDLQQDSMSVECLDESKECIKLDLKDFASGHVQRPELEKKRKTRADRRHSNAWPCMGSCWQERCRRGPPAVAFFGLVPHSHHQYPKLDHCENSPRRDWGANLIGQAM